MSKDRPLMHNAYSDPFYIFNMIDAGFVLYRCGMQYAKSVLARFGRWFYFEFDCLF